MTEQWVNAKDEGQDGLFVQVDPTYGIFRLVQREDGLTHDLILSYSETKELGFILHHLTSDVDNVLPEPQSNE